jgi:hypothetical protein
MLGDSVDKRLLSSDAASSTCRSKRRQPEVVQKTTQAASAHNGQDEEDARSRVDRPLHPSTRTERAAMATSLSDRQQAELCA